MQDERPTNASAAESDTSKTHSDLQFYTSGSLSTKPFEPPSKSLYMSEAQPRHLGGPDGTER